MKALCDLEKVKGLRSPWRCVWTQKSMRVGALPWVGPVSSSSAPASSVKWKWVVLGSKETMLSTSWAGCTAGTH